MAFYDFMAKLDRYAADPNAIERLNERHKMLVTPLTEELEGARVLDLAAHDGRWAYAFAAAGAREVVGIEGRQELIDQFEHYPRAHLRDRITLKCNDIFEGMEAEIAAGARYDVVGVLGILYHVMDHFRLFQLIRKLKPRLIIVDSEFALRPAPVIVLTREATDNILCSIPQVEGQKRALIGIPSRAAMEQIADSLGYRCEWLDWDSLPEHRRRTLKDYYRPEVKRRGTCLLRPAPWLAREQGHLD